MVNELLGDEHTQKHELDILHDSLWTAIPRFAMPVAATGILEQLSTLIDTVMIGRLMGADGETAMAAVSSNTPVTSMMLILFIGISLGTNVVIAQAIGANDTQTVHKAVHTSIVLSLIGVVVMILGELLAEPLLVILNVPDVTFAQALLFLRVYLLGMPSILLYNFEAAIFRSMGITKMPMQALIASSAINAALIPFFINVCGWGVAGAAAATAIAYTIAATFLFWRLTHIDSLIRLDVKKIHIDKPVLMRILSIGVPAGIQGAVFSVANVVIQSCINSLGTDVMAASGAVVSIEYVIYQLLNSFSQACTTFVGQNYGAGNIERCKQTMLVCLIEGEIVNLTNLTVMFFIGRTVVGLFLSEPNPNVVELGYLRMMTLFPAYTFSMAYESMSGYMRGFGISLPPALLTALGVCGTRLLWVIFVFPKAPTFQTIMTIYPFSLGFTTLLIFIALIIVRPSKTFANKVL